MRSFILFAALCVISSVSGFRLSFRRPQFSILSRTVVRMSEEPKAETSTSLIPIDLENIETASSITGGILGLILAGPVGGLIFAAIAKYVTKKENDAGEALRGLGKTIIESYNFITKLNGKYDISGKVTSAASSVVSKVEVQDSETLDTVKKTFESTISKAKELNEEFDIVNQGKKLLVAAGTLSDAALEKVEELNSKVISPSRSYFLNSL